MEEYYDLSYTVVSLIFLTPFAGYSVAAFLNARIHMKFGQRGIAILAPICHIITFVVLAVHPPWPVLVVCNAISGFGNGLLDACFCAWIGVMDKASYRSTSEATTKLTAQRQTRFRGFCTVATRWARFSRHLLLRPWLLQLAYLGTRTTTSW